MPYIKKENLEKLVTAGIFMSNICFNLKQNNSLSDQHRQSMAESQIRWDKELKYLRDSLQK